MKEELAFLFGAGVSIPAGFPSTREITSSVLNGVQGNKNQQQVKSIISFLQIIKGMIADFYQDKDFSYEDLYYVVNQLKDFKDEYENPIVPFFVDKLKETLRYSKINKQEDDYANIEKMADLGVHYINDTVTELLSKKPGNLEYFNFVKECLGNSGSGKLNIFTLNHDILLETYLKNQYINYCDGFKREGDIGTWEPELFMKKSTPVNILKLHGSINWYKYPQTASGRHTRGYFFGCKDNSISHFLNDNYNERPLILTGRSNKILEYNRGIYVDLHYYFYRLLGGTVKLIISGYSFRDKGINSWLIDWMDASVEKKLLLISPDTKKCIQQARHGIWRNWEKWKEAGRVNEISVPIEGISWDEIYKKI